MPATAPLPDAAPTNWVDAHAPPPLRPWLKLARLDRPVGIWLLMLPGWQGIALASALQGQGPAPSLLVLFFLGSVLMRSAGCAFNDIVDRDIDAKVARTAQRPIPAGQISVKQAWAFVIACSLVSLAILLALPPLCWLLGLMSLGLVAAYPFMKRITWWPQAWLGLTFNWGVPLGFAAAFPALKDVPAIVAFYRMAAPDTLAALGLAALALYASGIFWTLGYDTIYAIQDLEDDALVGVKSSARRLGDKAPRAVGFFYLLTIALAFVAGTLAHLGLAFSVALFAFAIHLGLQVRRVKVGDGVLALRLFQSNVWAGLILFVAIVAGGVLP